ncbi:wall-associated receptor kinase-like 6 isoform X2 [Vitis vinifera]|uniref:wall-associated receptor kinase-like 6 isoform X2 n=1 Tax=Vitis vinifera TaxID=29760 RepID=UPI0028833FAB|nr:wall-associated receptor kinase-like 6 isoform X2 [Vitis vinifera]
MIMKLGLLLIISFLCLTAKASSPPDEYMVKPNCRYRCGNVTIPFPFGIGDSCYLNVWYSVNCSVNMSSGAEKPFLNHTKLNLELLNVSLEHRTVEVNSPIASYDQRQGESNTSQPSIDLDKSPFLFSRLDNIFVVLGCGQAKLMDHENVWADCTSICNNSYPAQGRNGFNFCQTPILSTDSYYRNNYLVGFTRGCEGNNYSNSTTHAFLVDRHWFSHNSTKPEDITRVKYAPLSLLWKTKSGDNASSDCNRIAYYNPMMGLYVHYSCSCPLRHEGNPYLPKGCDHVVKECTNCRGTCDYRYRFDDPSYRKYHIEYSCITKDRLRPIILGNISFISMSS